MFGYNMCLILVIPVQSETSSIAYLFNLVRKEEEEKVAMTTLY